MEEWQEAKFLLKHGAKLYNYFKNDYRESIELIKDLNYVKNNLSELTDYELHKEYYRLWKKGVRHFKIPELRKGYLLFKIDLGKIDKLFSIIEQEKEKRPWSRDKMNNTNYLVYII